MGDIFIQWGIVLLVCRVADGAANRYSLGGRRPPAPVVPLHNESQTPGTCGTHASDWAFDWKRPRSPGVLVSNNALFFTKVASDLQDFYSPCLWQHSPGEKLLPNLTQLCVRDTVYSIAVKISMLLASSVSKQHLQWQTRSQSCPARKDLRMQLGACSLATE